jgi:rod shape-determining protein MreC
VPRNRTARAAVLAGSVRSAAPAYPSRTRNVVRRRVVLGTLVLLSLALITISVREADHGALHRAQDAGASVLRPFQVAAERVARPFRDMYGYFSDLVGAKSDNKKLRKEVEQLRQQAIANQNAARDAAQFRAMLRYQDSARFPHDYRAVNARVISFPSGPFTQEVGIAAGSSSGIRPRTPVVSVDGNLVGETTRVTPHTSTVTLLTDPDSAASAFDQDHGVIGLLQHGPGNTLKLDLVTKDKVVHVGDVIVTAGTQTARFPSLYPRGIPIGVVTSVQPYVDFTSLDSVSALVTDKPVPEIP